MYGQLSKDHTVDEKRALVSHGDFNGRLIIATQREWKHFQIAFEGYVPDKIDFSVSGHVYRDW